mmetsp:Transcript_50216/g.83373  ORF Transcript_50216/g.83373 Transcript_50216/m.83373 type:complete len:121 (-) Transcript_50216:599-961(-)|eukprot:CAMPEP_0184349342 /NCGR_PEP_ID=MMETSP1089-20130417/32328_1 /TAXON_ID=38269 ORGANISM="Gloeochaete wittrockiana, Strain SAG46.84" /NCGR_SAMPLE_ID=MMETSP1089 /ASSEMBLY_ACC=CAM_ASM_000445 /LENGTH=120 /DNA_ID=CAMNT_0026681479 /DNA_START=63 /DNA_END=425 /DNA_ORIENTATION=-
MDKASLANLFKNLNELEAAGNKFFDHLQAAIENPYSTQDASADCAALSEHFLEVERLFSEGSIQYLGLSTSAADCASLMEGEKSQVSEAFARFRQYSSVETVVRLLNAHLAKAKQAGVPI